jgi:hypothetical protein
MYTIMVICLFIVWGIVSITNQWGASWLTRILQFDYFSLIPYWTFFAPNPGQTDYHLVFRDKFVDGTVTPWTEVDVGDRRTAVACIWNPGKRPGKVLADVASGLALMIAQDPDSLAVVCITYHYMILLNVLEDRPLRPPGALRQFAIVETGGYTRDKFPNVVVTSEYHARCVA